MKQNLSPSILFHFTSKESLFKILASSFQPFYSLEKIQSKDDSITLGVPMVSFCDLRLSEIADHMVKYGKYGIGMSKQWASTKGLNPVFYVSKDSPFTDYFIKSQYLLATKLHNKELSLQSTDEHNFLVNLYDSNRYMKNYENVLRRM